MIGNPLVFDYTNKSQAAQHLDARFGVARHAFLSHAYTVAAKDRGWMLACELAPIRKVTIAGEKWDALNTLSRQWDIHLYPHNHSPAYNFLQDGPTVTVTEDRVTGAPIAPTQVRGESGKRLMQHYLDVTDPALCPVEMDVYWAYVAQHQHHWRFDWDGNRVEDIFDPLATVARQTLRYPLYHAKDGDSTG